LLNVKSIVGSNAARHCCPDLLYIQLLTNAQRTEVHAT